LKFQVSGFRFQVSGFRFQVSAICKLLKTIYQHISIPLFYKSTVSFLETSDLKLETVHI